MEKIMYTVPDCEWYVVFVVFGLLYKSSRFDSKVS